MIFRMVFCCKLIRESQYLNFTSIWTIETSDCRSLKIQFHEMRLLHLKYRVTETDHLTLWFSRSVWRWQRSRQPTVWSHELSLSMSAFCVFVCFLEYLILICQSRCFAVKIFCIKTPLYSDEVIITINRSRIRPITLLRLFWVDNHFILLSNFKRQLTEQIFCIKINFCSCYQCKLTMDALWKILHFMFV